MLIVPVHLEMVEDLRDDIKEDPELGFGGCSNLDCPDDSCFGVHLSINKVNYVIYVCKKHMEILCNDFGKNPLLSTQEKLDV